MRLLYLLFIVVVLTAISFNCSTKGASLEVVATFEGIVPANPAINSEGRIFITKHPLDNADFSLMEIVDGKEVPYPNEATSRDIIKAAIAIGVDGNDILWVLDMALGKLLGYDTKVNSLYKEITLPNSVKIEKSFLQDFAIDKKRGFLYIADMSQSDFISAPKPAIIVVNLESGTTKRLLEGHESFLPESNDITIEGQLLVAKKGETEALHLGLNPIAIDANNEWVYYGGVNGLALYRIPSMTLSDFYLSEEMIAKNVEKFPHNKVPSDGIAIDQYGNIYITDIQNNAIGVVREDAEYKIIAQDDELLSWSDGIVVSSDAIYITANKLHRKILGTFGKDDKTYLLKMNIKKKY